MKIRIRHEYKGVPYELEMETEALENISLLHGILTKLHMFIDRIVEAQKGG